ncbi:SDR family NAD(P)-dependent oxidoreductase [Acuticoccus mangrovi]|uniref:SDR family oxidoreductase n=1 Tax=Acuticoccus mangrovi TaxID=2796142 RepID=A0A934MIC3_9HYPH|nr:SDR family oxidoreductase [Acuticoccus mangrovi]MBJ3777041.1 SDR family oxidoreductase [Acuticoccus mangrovi]
MSSGGEFEGRAVLVTGAGRPGGQGAAIARLLLARGAAVVIGDVVERAAGDALAAGMGPNCRYVPLDVTRAADWDAALEIAEALGTLTGLVNNAAIYHPHSLAETTEADFRAHMEVNQLGPFLGMQRAAPRLAAAGGGSIVNISSTAGLKGSTRAFAYCGTKWALRGMTKAAALALAKDAIRVNSVHPGPIDTTMLDVVPEAMRQARAASVPLGREGRAEEVAEIVVVLLSERSSYVTGAEVAVDGGVSL